MSWARFAAEESRLAEFVRERLHGRVAFLATVTAAGSPRVHPVTPVIDGTHLLVFMEPTSPKGHDLQRDGRYALHCGVEDARGGGGEVLLRGRGEIREAAPPASDPDGVPERPASRYVTFELSVDQVLITRSGSDAPRHTRWRASHPRAGHDAPDATRGR